MEIFLLFVSSGKFFRVAVFYDSIFEPIFRMSNSKGKGSGRKKPLKSKQMRLCAIPQT